MTAQVAHTPMSVIVPAHDEAAVIDRTLRSLAVGGDGLEIIVVCNGCSDDTAARARAHGVTVIELEEASKTEALNAGDRAAHHFPRFYVDADIAVAGHDLRIAANTFSDRVHAVSPRMRVEKSGRPWAVRAFYDVWSQLPYCRTLIGSGVFALDEIGRSRFGEFPPVIADDLYARLHVGPDERRVAIDASFPLQAPRTTRALIRVKTRAHLGQLQLRAVRPDLFDNEDTHHGRALLRLARDPRRWAAIVDYSVVRAVARTRARFQHRKGDHLRWERDETTR